MGTPIINLPQTAVLGLHAIKDRAVVIDGKVEIRPVSCPSQECEPLRMEKLTRLIDDVPRTYLRPSSTRRQRGCHFLGEDQGEFRPATHPHAHGPLLIRFDHRNT